MIKGKFSLCQTEDGGIIINQEDYDVECFNGDDYETTYVFDSANSEKLLKFLGIESFNDLSRAIVSKYGECLDKGSLKADCDKNGIQYQYHVWIS